MRPEITIINRYTEYSFDEEHKRCFYQTVEIGRPIKCVVISRQYKNIIVSMYNKLVVVEEGNYYED